MAYRIGHIVLLLYAAFIISASVCYANIPIEEIISTTQAGKLLSKDIPKLKEQHGPSLFGDLESYLLDNTKETEKRWFAAILMGHLGGSDAIQKLTAGLKHQEFFIRLASIKGLELIRDPQSVSNIHGLLFDPAMVVRAAAADTIAKFAQRSSVTFLTKALFDHANRYKGRSLWARKNFIYAIGSIGGNESVETLIKCLGENEAMIKKAALNALNPALDTRTVIDDKDVGQLSSSWAKWWKQISQQSTKPRVASEENVNDN